MWVIKPNSSLCRLVFRSKWRRWEDVATAIGIPYLPWIETWWKGEYGVVPKKKSHGLPFLSDWRSHAIPHCHTNSIGEVWPDWVTKFSLSLSIESGNSRTKSGNCSPMLSTVYITWSLTSICL
jgi:hypothetical protein